MSNTTKTNVRVPVVLDFNDAVESDSIENFVFLRIKLAEDGFRRQRYQDEHARISKDVKNGKLRLSKKQIEDLAEMNALAVDIKIDVNLLVTREHFLKNQSSVKEMYDKIIKHCNSYPLNIAILEDLKNQTLDAPINYSYTNEELNEIAQFYQDNMTERGDNSGDITFVDKATDSELCFGEIYHINKQIDKVVEFIKANQYTPYEAMIYIHNYATSFTYTSGTEGHLILGPLNGQEVVCSGYASLVKAIIDRLNMPGLKADIAAFNLLNSDKSGYGPEGHSICLVYIKDPKYKINGEYYNDASNDNKRYNDSIKNNGRFAHFLYPTSDLSLAVINGEPALFVECESSNRHEQVISAPTERNLENDVKKVETRQKIAGSDNKLANLILRVKNKPIPLDTLILGLYNVMKHDSTMIDEYKHRTVEGAIKSIIFNSALLHKKSFRPEAINALAPLWNNDECFDVEDNAETKIQMKKVVSDRVNATISKLLKENIGLNI